MFKDWFAAGAEAQTWMGKRDTAELKSIGSHPRENSSIPLTNWWIRQDIVLVIFLLRGILRMLLSIVLLLCVLVGITTYSILA